MEEKLFLLGRRLLFIVVRWKSFTHSDSFVLVISKGKKNRKESILPVMLCCENGIKAFYCAVTLGKVIVGGREKGKKEPEDHESFSLKIHICSRPTGENPVLC